MKKKEKRKRKIIFQKRDNYEATKTYKENQKRILSGQNE